jgi:drug/metabolite transporter (DMT)-like permease
LLVGITLSLNDEAPAAILCLAGAAGSFALSNLLVRRIRLYRFGIEEAAAIAGGTLLALAAGIFAASPESPEAPNFLH